MDNKWHTWIDYPRFTSLIQRYYQSKRENLESKGETPLFTFTSTDYMLPTPDWAVYQSPERGFDPIENRWKRNKKGEKVLIDYKASDSGCG